MVADYVKESENHVMYRVTPVFEGDNLVASGVQMEAESVEDNGEGVSFNAVSYTHLHCRGTSKHCFLNENGRPISLKREFLPYHEMFMNGMQEDKQ